MRGAVGVVLIALSLAISASSRAGVLDSLRTMDMRLATVMFRLTTANASLCPRRMPGTGMVVHALEQYAPASRDEAQALFGFPATMSIMAIVPGSPAAMAGLLPGDGLTRINGVAVRDASARDAGTSARRDEVERLLGELPPADPIRLSVRRGEQDISISITPEPACRTRFEVSPGLRGWAMSDGETIQLSARIVAIVGDADLAVVAAHELAHTILGHRVRNENAKTNHGRFGRPGRSAHLVRRREDEADRLSVHLLANAGLDPMAAVHFWQEEGRAIGGGLFRAPTHRKPKARAALVLSEIKLLRPSR